MKERIEQLLEEVNAFAAKNIEELEALRIKYLSKKGEISNLFNDFRSVPNEQTELYILFKLCLAAQSCLTLCDSMDSSPSGSSVNGIFQARILGWVAISSSRGFSRPRD